MSSAKLIANDANGRVNPDEPVPVAIRKDGTRKLRYSVIVNLGVHMPELEKWARAYGHFADDDWTVRPGVAPEPTVEIIDRHKSIVQNPASTLIRVGEGFIYDGASLPMLAVVKLIAGNKEKYEVAGLLHDKLYRIQAPRYLADEVFKIVAASGIQCVSPTRAWWCWAALRAGGWKAYWDNGKRLRGES